MNKDDLVYIKHIRDSILRIMEYTRDIEYQKFIKSNLIQDGVIRQLQIIGEATKKLSSEFRAKEKQFHEGHYYIPFPAGK